MAKEEKKKWCVEVHNLTSEQTIEIMNTLLELGYAQCFALEEKTLNIGG